MKPAPCLLAVLLIAAACRPAAALEIRVLPRLAPVGGVDMSHGSVRVKETGETRSLSPSGLCRLEGRRHGGKLTIGVFVPGFHPAEAVIETGDRIEILLDYQSFESDAVVLDLGDTAARFALAGDRIDEFAAEAAAAPPMGNPNSAPDSGPVMINPFAVIEMIIGESIPEILGLDG